MASRTSTDPIEILLELGIDLDNISSEKDYLNALKEGIATITFLTKGKGDARLRILSQEVIKVRSKRKAADAKFKAKRTTVSASSFKKGTATAGRQKALPPSRPTTSLVEYQKPQRQAKEKPDKATKAVATTAAKQQSLLVGIAKSVDNIAKILKKQYNLKKKSTSYDRKQAERDRRKVQESNLEKGFKGLKKVAEKVVAPVKGILGELLDFFVNILIGRFLYKLFDWFGKPENQKKLDSVIRFFTDFAPALISGFLLFGTSIGRFVTRLTFTLVKGASKLIGLLPGWAKVGALLFGAGAIIPQMFPGTVKDDADKQADELANRVGKDKAAENIRNQQGGFFDFLTGAGQEREEQSQRLETGQEKKYGFFGEVKRFGGAIRSSNKITGNSGTDVTGAGVDTQLIAAQPGEVVINKKTVDAVGADYFLGLNRKYGGANANKPKLARVQTASGGGFVLPAFRDGGPIGGGPTFAEHANDFKERYISGDKSFLNQLAHGNTKKALEILGIKIDNNTEAVNKNTKQRREDNYTLEGIVAGAVGLAQSLEQQAAGLYNQALSSATQLYDRSVVFPGQLARQAKETYDQSVRGFYAANTDRMRDAEAERYVTQAEFDKLSPEEQLDKLVVRSTNKDGVVTSTKTALTARNQERQTATIEKLKKGLNSENPFEKLTAGIMNEGMIALPSQMLKNLGATEGFDKAISGLSGGRLKKASAAMSAVEMTLKGLLGPLGMPFKTDASSILEYNKPLMDFAIKNNLVNSKGEYLVGKDSWSEILGSKAYATQDISLSDEERRRGFRIVGGTKGRQGEYTVIDDKGKEQTRYTEHLYDKMQRESMGSGAAAKIANYGLGQFAFSVDQESGKAKVTDSWDSNNSAAYYFGESEQALKNGDVYNALFKGFSGLLRVNQNSFFGLGDTGFANTLPAGVDITSRSGFQKALTSTPSSMQKASEQVANSTASKGYFSSTTGQFYPSYADALKDPRVKAAAQIEKTKNKFSLASTQPSGVSSPPPPPPSLGSNITVVPRSSTPSQTPGSSNNGSKTNAVNPGAGDQGNWNIFGIPVPKLF